MRDGRSHAPRRSSFDLGVLLPIGEHGPLGVFLPIVGGDHNVETCLTSNEVRRPPRTHNEELSHLEVLDVCHEDNGYSCRSVVPRHSSRSCHRVEPLRGLALRQVRRFKDAIALIRPLPLPINRLAIVTTKAVHWANLDSLCGFRRLNEGKHTARVAES